MYLPTAFIGSQRKKFLGKDCLTWDEVRALKSDGARFGSHTVNHPKLYQLSWPEIEKELRDSKSQIERELGTECGSFTYPYAFPQEDTVFTSRFAELLKRLGYHHCNTTVIGRLRSGDDVFKIKRLPANDCDDRALFTAKLAGNYDWMGRMQTTFRRLKRILRVGPARPVDLSATPAHAAA